MALEGMNKRWKIIFIESSSSSLSAVAGEDHWELSLSLCAYPAAVFLGASQGQGLAL